MSSNGCAVFFTGLPGSGKTTIAQALRASLQLAGGFDVELLDGDDLRTRWSPPLGYSKADRNTHIHRVAVLADRIVRRGGFAICAVIAPYDDARRRARQLLEQSGDFLLVHLSTPLAICEQRDSKGQYRQARLGLIPHFTAVSDPYEPPDDADITLDTSAVTPNEAAAHIRAAVMRLTAGVKQQEPAGRAESPS